MGVLSSELILKLRDGVTGPAKAIDAAMGKLGKTIRGSLGFSGGPSLDAMAKVAGRRVSELRGSMVEAGAGALALAEMIKAPIKAAMDFEAQMVAVKKVADFNSDGAFKQFGVDLVSMSKVIPVSIAGLAAIASAAGQAGIATKDLLPFTEMAAKMGVALDVGADKAGDSFAKLMTALKMTQPQVQLLGDAINQLSNAQASSAADILDVVNRVAAQGKVFGYTATQTAAFGSAMLSAGVESEIAATSFRNMGLALVKGANATKGQKKAWKLLGMDSVSVAKQMQKDAVGTTLKVMEALAKLPRYMQATTASELFGNEARGLPQLLDNIKLLRESLGMVAKEHDYAGSASKEYASVMSTTASNVRIFQNRINALGVSIGTALLPPLNAVLGVLSPIADGLAVLTTAFPGVTRTVTIAIASLWGARIAFLGLRFAMAYTNAAALGVLAGLSAIGRGAIGAVVGLIGMLNPLRLVATTLGLLKFAIRGVLIGTGIGALIVAGGLIYENWDNIRVAIEAFRGAFWRALGPETRRVISSIVTGISELWDKITGIMGPTSDLGDKWAVVGIWAGKLAALSLEAFIGWVEKAWAEVKRFAAVMTEAAAKGWSEFIGADWVALGGAVVRKIGEGLKGIGSAFTDLAREGWAAVIGYDWAGLGRAIVQAIIDGIKSVGGSLADSLKSILPSWAGGGGGGGGGAPGGGGGGGGGGGYPSGIPGGAPSPGYTTPTDQPKTEEQKRASVDPTLQALVRRTSAIAGVPLNVYSGFRSIRYNRGVGGAGNSLHTHGRAVDLASPGHPKSDREFWQKVGTAYKMAAHEMGVPGVRWGGDFARGRYRHDNDHFDLGATPARARGGPVTGGRTYLVGERGMELFTAGSTGTVHANDKLREAVSGAGKARGRSPINFAPVIHAPISGGAHLRADDVADAIASRLHRDFVSVIDGGYSD